MIELPTPRQALRELKTLFRRGLSEDHFQAIHRMPKRSSASHGYSLGRIDSFKGMDSRNVDVALRMKFILDNRLPDSPVRFPESVFDPLVMEAVAKFPIRRDGGRVAAR